MRTALCFFAVAFFFFAPGPAFAQPRVELPPIVAPGAALGPRIARIEARIDRLAECEMIDDIRTQTVRWSGACRTLHRGLARATSEADAHAFGRSILEIAASPTASRGVPVLVLMSTGADQITWEAQDFDDRCGNAYGRDRAPVRGHVDVVLPYLLHAIDTNLRGSREARFIHEAFEAATRLAGYDPQPFAYWGAHDNEAVVRGAEARLAALDAWIDSVPGETAAARFERGIARSITDLSASSFDVRYAAMLRLVGARREIPRVEAALAPTAREPRFRDPEGPVGTLLGMFAQHYCLLPTEAERLALYGM